jgi:hypothetical protein
MDLSEAGNAATIWTPCDHGQVDTIIAQVHAQISGGPRHGISRLSGECPGSQPIDRWMDSILELGSVSALMHA